MNLNSLIPGFIFMQVTLKIITSLSVTVILQPFRRLSVGESEICSSSIMLVDGDINEIHPCICPKDTIIS